MVDPFSPSRGLPPRTNPLARVRAFARSREAIAAVEFALIMPVLMIFMLGGGEIARFVNEGRQLTNLANSMASLVAERTTNIGYYDLLFVFNSAMVSFPQLLKDASQKGKAWNQDISITISDIVFTPTVAGCTSGCTYTAKTKWSMDTNGLGARCQTITQSQDTDAPSYGSLPRDVYNSGTMIVADIVYNYTAVFGSAFVPATLTIRRSVYLQPRYLSEINNVIQSNASNVPMIGPVYFCP